MIYPLILAILPIIILIGLGIFLRRQDMFDPEFWPQAERLSYFVLLPALFFYGLATVDVDALPVTGIIFTLIGSTLAIAALLVLLRPIFSIDGPAFTSVFQGSIRFNNYIGVTAAAGLFGAKGIALAAICNAAIVPTVNILCVLVFAYFGSPTLTMRQVVRQLLTNPLILASVGGIAFNLMGLKLPPGIEPSLEILGKASLPIGLICIGAALDFRAMQHWFKPVVASAIFKFLLMPIATLIVAYPFGLNGPALITALLFQALPTASSSYIMARQLGGDAPLMAGITAVQTMLSLILLPMIIYAYLRMVAF
jgi:malonate transporter and related proteins